MNKIVKKIIAASLCAATIAPHSSITAKAWTPTDYEDYKCIDLRGLNEKRNISLPEKIGQKVCGCKTCTVDAVAYEKIGDYISKLENEFKILAKEEDSLECRVKMGNLKSVLSSISRQIEDRDFINKNFLLTSTNYKANEQGAIAQFIYKDGITSNYNVKHSVKKYSFPFIEK